MGSRIGLEVVQNRASYEKFHFYEPPMLEKFGSCWVNQAQLRSMSLPLAIVDVRSKVIAQLKNIPVDFPQFVSKQESSYSLKKGTIPSINPLEKQLNDRSMDRCENIFIRQFKAPLLQSVKAISQLLPTVEQHFNQFQKLLEDVRDPQVARGFIERAHAIRREINQALIEVAHQSNQSIQKVAALTERGKAIGPAFTANPAIFLMGVPLMLPKNSALTGKPVEAVIDEIEGIKQERSVNQGVEPFHLLLMNALQSMRKLEKGMAKYWAKEYQIPSEFGLDFNPHKPQAPLAIPFPSAPQIAPLEIPKPSQKRGSIKEAEYLNSEKSHLLSQIEQMSKHIEELSGANEKNAQLQSTLDDIQKQSKRKAEEIAKLSQIIEHNQQKIRMADELISKTLGEVSEMEDTLICPITNDIMQDPVISTITGITYEKLAILDWLTKHSTCPVSQKPMKPNDLVPNYGLKAVSDRYMAQMGKIKEIRRTIQSLSK